MNHPVKHNKIAIYKTVLIISCLFFLISSFYNNSDPIKSSAKNKFTNYYFNAEKGNDSNDGTSKSTPFKSLLKLKSLQLKPGDKILLSSNSVFKNTLLLENLKGTENHKITISSYSPNNNAERASINVTDQRNAIKIVDCSFIVIKNLKVSANSSNDALTSSSKTMRCGILIKPKKNGTTENITLDNIVVENIFYEKPGFERPSKEVKSANGTQNYGWGIRVINSNMDAIIKDISIKNCEIKNVSHTGIKFTGKNRTIQNIEVINCKVLETGGPGIQMSGVSKGLVANNYVNKSGSNNDSRKWGRGSGLWTWGCSDILIEKNYFLNANGPADSAGVHIDFNCNNIIIQYNFSANNAGGFCEILGNNYNCAYRYNISVNDGYRVKGKNGGFQEGKTLWLSGFVGKNKKRNGPFNSYIYNNTIYVSKDIVSKFAFDKASDGVLIMNNIFYIEGESKSVLGDQYKPDTKGVFNMKDIVFKNNLFLNAKNWPIDIPIKDILPIFGNPKFKNNGGLRIQDYIPSNITLIQNKGHEILRIPNDSIGIILGLKVTHDILGNPIVDNPDLGAIELQ